MIEYQENRNFKGVFDVATYPTQFRNIGFEMDTPTTTGYRVVDGFGFTVKVEDARMYTLRVPCAVRTEQDAQAMNEALKAYERQNFRTIKNASYDGRMICIRYIGQEMLLNIEGTVGPLIDLCMETIRRFGAVPVCARCGRTGDLGMCGLHYSVEDICSHCFEKAKGDSVRRQREEDEKVENMPFGLLGAALGGLGGAVLWIVFSFMGKIVLAAGVVSVLAVYYGYKWLAKKVSYLGLGIALALGFVLLLTGMYFAMGIDIHRALNDAGIPLNFGEALGLMPDYIKENLGVVLFNNIFGVFSYIAGTVICVILHKNSKKVSGRAVRL